MLTVEADGIMELLRVRNLRIPRIHPKLIRAEIFHAKPNVLLPERWFCYVSLQLPAIAASLFNGNIAAEMWFQAILKLTPTYSYGFDTC